MKGLASQETRKIVLDQRREKPKLVPIKFWCKNSLSKSEQCCFWHFIFFPHGGPERDGVRHPVYQYEQEILESLEHNKCIAVYKATGLGLTEFVLLWILWKSYTDEFFQNKEAIIITGPNVDLAQDLIRRAKRFLLDKGLKFSDHGAYELDVNKSRIKCYPSNNIHSARGKPKVSVFFGDEAAFFKLRDDSIVRTVGERYIGKNNAWVIWVSTAGEDPAGFFYDILNEEYSNYKKHEYYWEWGLKPDPQTGQTLFKKEYIEEAQKARSFDREFCGIWGRNVGDIFSQEAIDEICSNEYKWTDDDSSNDRVMGIDPAFGSSNFGIVITQKRKGSISVIFAEDYERASVTEMFRKINELARRFRVRRMFVDSSWPEGIKELRDTYHYDVTRIPWNEYGEKMLDYLAEKVGKLEIEIHPMFKKLRQQLETIRFNKKGLPDKNTANTFDLGDALVLACWYYKMGSGVIVGVY